MPAPTTTDRQQTHAAAVGQRLYGYRPSSVVRLASGSNAVFRLEFGGLPAKVVKLPGRVDGIVREQSLLRKLRAPRWGLPVPAVEFTQTDVPARWEVGGTFYDRPAALTVMQNEPGMPLADAVLRGEPWAGEALRAAGAFAAHLADVPPTLIPGALRAQSSDRAERAIRLLHPVVSAFQMEHLTPQLEVVAALKQQTAASLAHGDLGLQNLVAQAAAGGVRLCVCDWETARPGWPLADLAGLLTSLAALPVGDAGRIAFLRRRTLDGYASARALDPAATVELVAWETYLHFACARYHLDRGRPAAAAQRAALASVVHET